ncbi:MAG: polysaccharide biosynthesis protein, partial [Clostridiaceae bacterium]|nr:polysaccharide biosynthesis protein [Clostridiaceae bacterium]
MEKNQKTRIVRIIALVLFDIVAINLAFYLSYYLRFDRVSAADLAFIMRHAPFFTLTSLVVFYFFRLYTSVWRYASTDELIQVVAAAFFSTALMVSYFIAFQITIPRSIFVFWGILTMLFTGGLRMSYRLLRHLSPRVRKPKIPMRRVMIIGAGDAGAVIIRELKNHSQLNSLPVVAIDDNITKRGTYINRVPIVGARKDIVRMVKQHKIDEIIIAIPSASQHEIREIVGECQKTGCEIKILPGIYELIDGRIDIHAIRKVKIEDLLGRDEVQLDRQKANRIITGKTVLVTGAGGSIGSELVRQLALYHPNELVLFDFYENSVYDLQNELSRNFSVQHYDNGYEAVGNFDFRLRVFIGSVRDQQRVHEVLHETRPDLIFHAAAHKHVPLMEGNPKEAVKNNVFGTFNV